MVGAIFMANLKSQATYMGGGWWVIAQLSGLIMYSKIIYTTIYHEQRLVVR